MDESRLQKRSRPISCDRDRAGPLAAPLSLLIDPDRLRRAPLRGACSVMYSGWMNSKIVRFGGALPRRASEAVLGGSLIAMLALGCGDASATGGTGGAS